MSRKGENIYKRKDGRWEARFIKTYSPDGRARYGYCYAASYREVKEKLQKAKLQVLPGKASAASGGKKLFSACCDEWLRQNSLRIRESTYVKYRSIIDNHIKPELGACMLYALTTDTVDEFTRDLLDEGLSPKTVKDILVLLKSVVDYAKKTRPGMVRDIEITYPREGRKEMRVLSREEQRRFTQYLLHGTDSVKFGILLSLYTGLRIGEICALRWGDISQDERVIRVRSTMQRLPDTSGGCATKTKIVISEPKSNSSVRIIPLTEYTAHLCANFDRHDPGAFVLSGSSDRFIEPRLLQYKLKQYTKACGLEGVHFHTLRHSFATRCVEVDFEIKSLSEILGHSSPQITLDRYVHSSIELKRSNMDKLSRLDL